MNKVIVLVVATALIGAIVWWFFGKRKNDVASSRRVGDKQVIEVTVNGGYSPSLISLQKNVPAEIIFTRTDPSSCLEEIVFPDFGIREKLPLNQPHIVKLNPDTDEEITFACGMNMFFGKIHIS